jgi:hypothetical protein
VETADHSSDDFARPPLRRGWLRGYRAPDVDVYFLALKSELLQLRLRIAELESDRRELRGLLDDSRRLAAELASTAAEAAARGQQVAAEAQRDAQAIRDAALVDAARVRDDAVGQSTGLRTQIDSLLRLRDTLAATIRTVVRDFERVMADGDLQAPAPLDARPAAPAPLGSLTSVGSVAPPAAERSPSGSRNVFGRHVEVEAGPFSDFSSLSAFESALAGLPKVEDVYIRRFEAERATIEVTLEEPAPLLDEMAQRMPYSLTVDRTDGDRIELSVAAGR